MRLYYGTTMPTDAILNLKIKVVNVGTIEGPNNTAHPLLLGFNEFKEGNSEGTKL